MASKKNLYVVIGILAVILVAAIVVACVLVGSRDGDAQSGAAGMTTGEQVGIGDTAGEGEGGEDPTGEQSGQTTATD